MLTFRACCKTPFSSNGIWREPESNETCKQQNLVGLFNNVCYCNEFNRFALAYARVDYGLRKSFQGSAKGRTPTELKKVGKTCYEDQRKLLGKRHF